MTFEKALTANPDVSGVSGDAVGETPSNAGNRIGGAGEADPFFITGPALISFSGGRTSAYMLWRILQAHGGALPDDVHVCFANTGKEREETLRFVHDCATHWGVRVRWLEFVTDLRSVGAAGRFQEVGFNSASRNGEPFDRLIQRKQAIPSTVSGRWCTQFLKVGVLHDFMETQGFAERGSFTEVIGLRADEKDRVERLTEKPSNLDRKISTPLAQAGQRKPDIFAFWPTQPFDLQLERGLGNCDHCPFIGDKQRVIRARRDPKGVFWWAKHEADKKMRFGRLMSMVEILGQAASQSDLFLSDEADGDGECGLWCAGEAA